MKLGTSHWSCVGVGVGVGVLVGVAVDVAVGVGEGGGNGVGVDVAVAVGVTVAVAVAVAVAVGVALGATVAVAVAVGAGVGVGLVPLRNRYSAGIWLTIGVRSGPIGGHGMLFGHQPGRAAKYKLFGITWSGIVGSQTVALLK
jgi:hypothetical protein